MDKLKNPINLDLEASKTYFFCTCGLSTKYPFCDGSHKASNTGKRSLPYVCEEAKTITYVNGDIKE